MLLGKCPPQSRESPLRSAIRIRRRELNYISVCVRNNTGFTVGVVVSHFVPKAFYTFREKKIKKREGERGNRCKGTELILIITLIEIKKVDLFLSYFFV